MAHRTTDGVAVGRLSGLEKIGDVLVAPFRQSLLGDVRHPALAFRIRDASEALSGDNAAEEIAGAVTPRPMAEAIDQISTAIHLRRARCVGREMLVVHDQPLPNS